MSGAIFDPVHGSIGLSRAELALCDAPALHRLRFIKQLGFAEMAFPGASHSRYSHSLGALHTAGIMFDQLQPQLPIGAAQASVLRQALRLALLCHDVGHAPMSHAAEQAMPAVGSLGLGAWQRGPDARQADHEDYTLQILLCSELGQTIAQQVGPQGVTAALVAALIVGRAPAGMQFDVLMADGHSLMPLMHALVSGELDADRMDYLRRDAHFTGVGYGNFDHLWLSGHLVPVLDEQGYSVALSHRAIWALENFLLARHHMFLAVYHHHTAVALDYMLGAHLTEAGITWPADPQGYLAMDDVALWTALRAADSPWARGIVARQPLKNVAEAHLWSAPGDTEAGADLEALQAALQRAGIQTWLLRRESLLSRYGGARRPKVPLRICAPDGRGAQPADAYTPLYRRYRQVAAVSRLFCWPHQAADAQAVIATTRAQRDGR